MREREREREQELNKRERHAPLLKSHILFREHHGLSKIDHSSAAHLTAPVRVLA